MSAFLRFYTKSLQSRPLATMMTASFTLFAAGDVLAQQAVEKKGVNHDFVRTLRLAAYGGFIFTPIVAPWYKLIERVSFKSKAANVVSKVALDQFVFAPAAIGLFFTCTTLMEGKSFQDAKDKLETAYRPTLITNWMLFIPFQAMNMSLVPLQHRLLAVNFVSLFWNTYLSLVSARSAESGSTHDPVATEEQKITVAAP